MFKQLEAKDRVPAFFDIVVMSGILLGVLYFIGDVPGLVTIVICLIFRTSILERRVVALKRELCIIRESSDLEHPNNSGESV